MARRSLFRTALFSASVVALSGCGPISWRPVPTSHAIWSSRATPTSAFHATLYEETFNDGESIIYSIRFEKNETGPVGGWFVKKELDGDNARPKRPELIWSSPKDLTVIVHTSRVEGRVVQRFFDQPGNDGSLTFDYRPDGLEQ